MPTMKRPYQLTALMLFFLSGFIAYESLQLKYYTTLGPGPGFFPLWLSLALAVLAVAMFYQATFRDSEPRPADFLDSRIGYLRAVSMCVAWIWATVMLERLGYRLTMLVVLSLACCSPSDGSSGTDDPDHPPGVGGRRFMFSRYSPERPSAGRAV